MRKWKTGFISLLIVSLIIFTACDNNDDDDDTNDDTGSADDGESEDEGFCGNPEREECADVCSEERSECSNASCGISPIDIDDPCGIYSSSDDDDDSGVDDWSNVPGLQEYCECIVACRDKAKECYNECSEKYPC